VSRCDLKQRLLEAGCGAASMEFPSSSLNVEKDSPLSDKASGTADDVTQIRPQRIRMTLRPGETMLMIPCGGGDGGGEDDCGGGDGGGCSDDEDGDGGDEGYEELKHMFFT